MTAAAALLASARAEVVDLATRASLAVRAEPALLRALRLEMRPRLEAGAEGDLWFSPLVEAHGIDGIVLRADVAQALRERLAARGEGALAAAWRITERLHAGASPAIRLEERIAWLALTGGEGAAAAVDAELRRALVALVRDGRRGIAAWALRALPRMPRVARDTVAAWLLALRSARDTGSRPALRGDPPRELADVDLSPIIPEVEEVDLGVLRDGRRLALGEVGGPPAVSVPVPATDPRYVELQLADGARQVVAVAAGRAVEVAVPPGPIRLRTADHRVYELPRPPPLRCFVSYSHQDGEWARRVTSLLERTGALELWLDMKLMPGESWRRIEDELQRAEVILALVSPSWLASESSRHELELSQRWPRHVIPILLTRSDWERTELKQYQALPRDGIPLSEQPDPEAALGAIAWELERLAYELRRGGSRTITVSLEGPADHRSIGEALSRARDGDVVRVRGGRYLEHVQLPAGVTLEGEDPARVILDGNGRGWVVCMADRARLTGFTIRGGGGETGVNDCGVMVEDCAGAVVTGNRIVENGHYGVILRRCEAEIVHNTLQRNAILGIYADEKATFDVAYNLFEDHRHSALNVVGTPVTGRFRNNTVVRCGAGILFGNAPEEVRVSQNIFADMPRGISVHASFARHLERNLFSNVEVPHHDWSRGEAVVPLREGNLVADARFARGHRLSADSPAVGAGEGGEDLGAFSFKTPARARSAT